MTDFAQFMPDVARALLGEPNGRLSKGDRWRYGNKGSLSVDVKRGTWKDFEADRGGGVIDLVMIEEQTDRGGAIQWLRDNGFVEDRSTTRRNVSRSKGGSGQPIRQRDTRPDRRKAPPKPKDEGTSPYAQQLWAQSEPIGDRAEHPFRAWVRERNLLHPYCAVPGGIRYHQGKGLIVAGVFPLSAWGTGSIPKGDPVAVEALAIDQGGKKRYVLGPGKDRDKCDYGPVSEGVFLLGDPTHQRVNIVEGVADALAVYSREPGAVLATLGTSKTLPNKPDVIDWLCTRETWLYPDNDENKASEQGTAALIDCIKVKSPDAKVIKVNARVVGDDPGEWAKKTPFADIERYDFEEKSGQFYDGGLSWGEADRMAVQTLNGEKEQ